MPSCREPRTVLGLRHAEEDCPSSQQSMVPKPEESMLDESKVIRGTFEVHNQLLPCLLLIVVHPNLPASCKTAGYIVLPHVRPCDGG